MVYETAQVKPCTHGITVLSRMCTRDDILTVGDAKKSFNCPDG